MPTYVTLYRYTAQGIKNVRSSPSRIEQAKAAISAAGGKLKGVFVTMGQYDLVAISEWPSRNYSPALRKVEEGARI